MSATAFSFEPLFLALAVAAAALYWRAARTDRPATWRVVAFGSGLFLIAASLNSPLETIAAQLPAAHPPAAERAHRGRGAAARRAGADAADAGEGRPPRRPTGSARAGSSRIWLGAWYLTHLAAVLRLGAAHRLGAEPRARDPHRGGPPLLVADRQRPPLAAGGPRLPRRRLRRLVVPRPRVHLLQPAVLLVLRARAAAVGPVAGARPEPRRDLHERRADARVPARDRLLRDAAARRGACARGGRRSRAEAAFGYIAEHGGSVEPCCSSSSWTMTWAAPRTSSATSTPASRSSSTRRITSNPCWQRLERHDVRLVGVLETHTHADHVSGHGRLALEHGVPIRIHEEAGRDLRARAARRRDRGRGRRRRPAARSIRRDTVPSTAASR